MEFKNGNIFKTLNQTFFVVNGSEPNLGNICMKNKRWEKHMLTSFYILVIHKYNWLNLLKLPKRFERN